MMAREKKRNEDVQATSLEVVAVQECEVVTGQGDVALAATVEQGQTGESVAAQDAAIPEQGENDSGLSTAYDDAFRTILTDCTRLILPVINEMFGTSYPMEAEVRLHSNERFLRGKDGKELKTIADSYIAVVGDEGVDHSYNIECQLTEDGSMLLRVFEYAVQIGLDSYELVDIAEREAYGSKAAHKGRSKGKEHPVLEVRLPASGIMYLRSTESTPSSMTVRMILPDGGSVEYEVSILKVKSYSLKEIAKKKLYFLIPFHLFKYESEFGKRERAGDAKEYFAEVSEEALSALQEGYKRGDIDLYEMQALREMYLRVTEQLAKSHQDVQEGVKKTMGGQVLNYEAKDIRNKALAEGRAEGRAEGQSSVFEAMRSVGVSEDKIFEAMQRIEKLGA